MPREPQDRRRRGGSVFLRDMMRPGSIQEDAWGRGDAVKTVTSVKVVEKRVSEEVEMVRPPWVEVWPDRRRSAAV
jgi:hypothetical protein